MAYSEGQLSGTADYRVGIDVWYSGVQDWGANTSRFDWNVRIVGTYGSWTNETCNWSASIGGVGYGGTFTLPSGWGSPRIVASGSTWIGHDGEGHRPGFASDAWMSVPHDRIGSGGSGQAWVDAPRIPKPPATPAPPTFSNITTNNIRVASGQPDNRGAGITAYGFQWAHDAGFTTGVGYREHNGYLLDIGPMQAGKDYYFRTRAYNERGWSGWSDIRSAKTKTALYFINPDNNVAETVELFAWNGSIYDPVELLIDPELDGTFVAPA